MTAHAVQKFAMSTAPVDIAVFSRNRRPVLVVEVENNALYSTNEEATDRRRCLMAHDLLPDDVPFYMVATRDRLFLWHGDAEPGAHPKYSATAEPIENLYGSGRANREKPFRGGAFEIAMFAWLSALARGALAVSPDSEMGRMLLESGLYEQIQGGSADFDVQL